MKRPNHSIQLMGASGSAWLPILGHGRLAPTAEARRWTATRDLELLLQDLHHEQAFRRATAEAIAAHSEMWSDARRKMRDAWKSPMLRCDNWRTEF
jgi:hypothetical protein